MLKEAIEALERLRLIDNGETADSILGAKAWMNWNKDKETIIYSALDFFKDNWKDPYEIKDLVELGFVKEGIHSYVHSGLIEYRPESGLWIVDSVILPPCMNPINIFQVQVLLLKVLGEKFF